MHKTGKHYAGCSQSVTGRIDDSTSPEISPKPEFVCICTGRQVRFPVGRPEKESCSSFFARCLDKIKHTLDLVVDFLGLEQAGQLTVIRLVHGVWDAQFLEECPENGRQILLAHLVGDPENMIRVIQCHRNGVLDDGFFHCLLTPLKLAVAEEVVRCSTLLHPTSQNKGLAKVVLQFAPGPLYFTQTRVQLDGNVWRVVENGHSTQCRVSLQEAEEVLTRLARLVAHVIYKRIRNARNIACKKPTLV